MQRSWKKRAILLLLSMVGVLVFGAVPAGAAGEIEIFTPYKNITVPPGETINYSLNIINNTNSIQHVPLAVRGLPDNWVVELQTNQYITSGILVKPGPENEGSVRLKVVVPLEVEKGTYNFTVEAAGFTSLPLTVNVSESGTYETELTTEQPNRQGDADSTFEFELDLENRTAENQLYALSADAPRGWTIRFLHDNERVTSVEVEAAKKESIDVEISPPQGVEEGTYKFPIRANAGGTSAETELEVVITGRYGINLTTPKGLLSASVTAGKTTRVDLVVENTGTAELTDVKMTSTAPIEWEVTFDQDTIDVIPPGESAQVTATIKASDKAIPGDYVTAITATTPEASSTATFRVAVKTSVLWGWLGILIIAAVLGGVFYLFRKYGRR